MASTILLFLQDKHLADIYRTFLERHGLSVVIASTPIQVKKALKKKSVKAVLTDEQSEEIATSTLSTIWLVDTLTPHRIGLSKQFPHVRVMRRQDFPISSLIKVIRSIL